MFHICCLWNVKNKDYYLFLGDLLNIIFYNLFCLFWTHFKMGWCTSLWKQLMFLFYVSNCIYHILQMINLICQYMNQVSPSNNFFESWRNFFEDAFFTGDSLVSRIWINDIFSCWFRICDSPRYSCINCFVLLSISPNYLKSEFNQKWFPNLNITFSASSVNGISGTPKIKLNVYIPASFIFLVFMALTCNIISVKFGNLPCRYNNILYFLGFSI